MEPIDLDELAQYVNENIVHFHQKRLASLDSLKLNKLLKKNPYLFRAKHLTTAQDLIQSLLEAFLFSSEEKLFTEFFEIEVSSF